MRQERHAITHSFLASIKTTVIHLQSQQTVESGLSKNRNIADFLKHICGFRGIPAIPLQVSNPSSICLSVFISIFLCRVKSPMRVCVCVLVWLNTRRQLYTHLLTINCHCCMSRLLISAGQTTILTVISLRTIIAWQSSGTKDSLEGKVWAGAALRELGLLSKWSED